MRSKLIAVLASILAAFQATVSAVEPVPDDAGSGRDAGGTPSTALMLAGFGAYHGAFDFVGDVDWYRVTTSMQNSPACAEARGSGAVSADMTLQLGTGSYAGAVTAAVLPGRETRLGLARLLTTATSLGFEPPSWNQQALPGPYDFRLAGFRFADLGPPDAGTGRDAGDTPATAIPVASPCIGGALAPAKGDIADRYTVDGVFGDRFVFSFASSATSGLKTDLIAPDGSIVATALPGDIIDLILLQDGTWTMSASTSGSQPVLYVLGILEPDPDPNPCRPHCT